MSINDKVLHVVIRGFAVLREHVPQRQNELLQKQKLFVYLFPREMHFSIHFYFSSPEARRRFIKDLQKAIVKSLTRFFVSQYMDQA